MRLTTYTLSFKVRTTSSDTCLLLDELEQLTQSLEDDHSDGTLIVLENTISVEVEDEE